MANREDLTDAIDELCDTRHMLEFALQVALNHLDLVELAAVFDHIADHHDVLTQHIRPRLGLAAEQEATMRSRVTRLAERAMRNQPESGN